MLQLRSCRVFQRTTFEGAHSETMVEVQLIADGELLELGAPSIRFTMSEAAAAQFSLGRRFTLSLDAE